MSKLFEEIRKIRMKAKIDRNEGLSMATGMIIGETQRIKNKKDITDNKILDIIDELISKEKEVLSHYKKESSNYLESLLTFKRADIEKLSENKIIEFLNTLDFSKLGNKLEAIKILKNEFGDKAIDGKIAKKIILEKY